MAEPPAPRKSVVDRTLFGGQLRKDNPHLCRKSLVALFNRARMARGLFALQTISAICTREQLKKALHDKGFLDGYATDASARAGMSNALNQLSGKHVVGTTKEHVWLPK